MIFNFKSTTDFSGFYIVFRGSTNLETKGKYGINHLIEHLICKGLKKIQSEFFSHGITWNAYTSLNEVVFYFRGLDDDLFKFKKKIISSIFNFDINKKDFELEKKIILQEFSEYFARPSTNHFYNFSSKFLDSHGPMGIYDDVDNISLLTVLDFYQKYYTEPSMIINVSGKHLYVEDTINFSSKTINKVWTLEQKRNSHSLPSIISPGQSSIIIYSKLWEEDFAWINFINLLLSADHSSILLDKLRSKRGLVYDIEANQTLFNKQSLVTISTMASTKKTEETVDLILSTLDEVINLIKEEHISKLRNNLIKTSKMKKIDRYKNISRWIYPENWEVETIFRDIDLSVLEKKIKKYYNPENFKVSIQSSE